MTAVDVGVPASVVGGDVAGTPTPPSSFTVVTVPEQFASAWVAALGELEDVPRTGTADAGSYKYNFAELADVLSLSRPVLARHGLAAFQVPRIVNGDVSVTTVVMHTSGVGLEFVPFDLPAGNKVQETGSATTYARRYSGTSILGMATKDDDGATAGTRDSKQEPVLMDERWVQKFQAAAYESLLTNEEIGLVVFDATQGRTIDPFAVYADEREALRESLARHTAKPGDAEDQYRPVSSESGEVGASTSPDQLSIEDTPDE